MKFNKYIDTPVFAFVKAGVSIYLSFLILCVFPSSSNSQNWISMGLGFSGIDGVTDLTIYNNEIYACGGLNQSGSTPINGIGRWNGSQWLPLLNGVNFGAPFSMVTYNGELIVAGMFQSISGVPGALNIARWDGTSWHALANGITGAVRTMEVYNGELYVGGNFTSVSSLPYSKLAKWNGTQWLPVGELTGTFTSVRSMAIFDNELYISGSFSGIDSISSFNIAKFNGSNWSNLDGGLGDIGYALFPDTVNNRLYVGGNFLTVDSGLISCSSNVAYWDNISWTAVGNGPYLYPRTLQIYNNQLYAGLVGAVVKSNGDTLNYITSLVNNDWIVMEGINCSVKSLMVHNNDLIVGGCFTTSSQISSPSIAIWNNLTSISYPHNNENCIIYPNPISNSITFQGCKESQIDIYNIYGEIVLQYSNYSYEDRITIILSSELSDGIYFCRMKNTGAVKKVILKK